MPTKPYTAHVCPHTHWDREWYSPFQTYRMRLVRLLDHLLDLLEQDADFRLFNLDGQTIPLNDYLEIRPENAERLRRLTRAQRIIVGPWYNLPDEFLVSGEAMVRNLLRGLRMAADYGSLNRTGYIPDTFGHISQLPQIFQNFGFDTMYAWRGLSGDELKSELWWDAPDGTRILLNKLPDYIGYSNACALPADRAEACKELDTIVRTQAARATTNHVLIMLGTDHLEPRPDLSELLRMANERSVLATYRISSYAEYAEAVKAAVPAEALQVLRGELRDTSRSIHGGAYVLPHVLSSRIYLKQQNVAMQTLLERWVEPTATYLWLLGADYPRRYIDVAWDWVLQNHPHDSICGTSHDHVHDQMEVRNQWAEDIGETLLAEQMDTLLSQLQQPPLPGEAVVAVFNPLAWTRSETVTVNLDIPAALFAPAENTAGEIDYDSHHALVMRERARKMWRGDRIALRPPLRGLLARDLTSGESIPVQIEDYQWLPLERNLRHGPMGLETVCRVRAAFHARDLPACGYRVLAVKPSPIPTQHDVPPPVDFTLENEFLRVRIESNGTLTLTDKTTTHTFSGLACFEDGGDTGDSYNTSPPLFDRVYTTLGERPRIQREAWGPSWQRYRIDFDWQLPTGLTDDRRGRQETLVSCPLTLRVGLGQGMRRVQLDVAFTNRAKDHRLRIVFPTGLQPADSHSDTPFDVVAHPLQMPPVDPAIWQEDAPSTFPATTFFDVSANGVGLAVLNVGLPEYEVSATGQAAVTLLRAVGWLGAGAFTQTIMGGAGPVIPTPGGQVLRQLDFRLGLVPHRGSWADGEIWREAHALNAPIRARSKALPHPVLPDERQQGDLPLRHSFLALDGKNVVLSSVVRSQDGAAVIVRVFNPSETAQQATLTMAWPLGQVKLARLDETEQEALPVRPDGAVQFTVAPHRIVTLKVWPRAS